MSHERPTEEVRLLRSAATEIASLRRKNELMLARLQMFDNIMLLLGTNIPRQGLTQSPDILFDINKHLSDLENKRRDA